MRKKVRILFFYTKYSTYIYKNFCVIIYEQIYIKLMKVSDLILEKIQKDRSFRLQTALALGVTERNIQILASKNSDNLTKFAAIKFYLSTGLVENEIIAI